MIELSAELEIFHFFSSTKTKTSLGYIKFNCIEGGMIKVTSAPNGDCDATVNVFTCTAANSQCVDVQGSGYKVTCPTTTTTTTTTTTSSSTSSSSISSGNVSENGASTKSMIIPVVFMFAIGALLK